MRFHFLKIEGEHLLHVNRPVQTANGLHCHTAHANWPVQTANGLHCHTAHANWPLQTAIVTVRAIYNAIQSVKMCASAIIKKHATLCTISDLIPCKQKGN